MNITLSDEQLDSIFEQMKEVVVVSNLKEQVDFMPEVDSDGIKLRPCLFDQEDEYIGTGNERTFLSVIKELCMFYYEQDSGIEESLKDIMLSELRESIRYIEEYKGWR